MVVLMLRYLAVCDELDDCAWQAGCREKDVQTLAAALRDSMSGINDDGCLCRYLRRSSDYLILRECES